MIWRNQIFALLGGVCLSFFVLSCGKVEDPYPIDNERNAKAVEAIFKANNMEVPDDWGFVDTKYTGEVISLNLANLGLDTLPPEIGDLTELQHLDLADNNLSELPEAFQWLTELVSVDLKGNQLTSLPEGFQNAELEVVDLSFNQLTSLPLYINVTHVKILDLEENYLTELPPDFRYLSRLEELNLKHNLLEALPDSMHQLASLTHLDVSWNKLTTISATITQLEPDYVNVANNFLCEPLIPSDSAENASLIEWLRDYARNWTFTQVCD